MRSHGQIFRTSKRVDEVKDNVSRSKFGLPISYHPLNNDVGDLKNHCSKHLHTSRTLLMLPIAFSECIAWSHFAIQSRLLITKNACDFGGQTQFFFSMNLPDSKTCEIH